MKNINSSIVINNNVWSATDGGAFMFNESENSFLTITKAEGFNSQDLTAVASDGNDNLWFGAAEGYLNVYNPTNGNISRIMDIFNTTETKKQINNIYTKGDTIFVSTDFDLSLINPNNLSFYDSFLKFGNFTSKTHVRSCYKNSLLYVLTDEGVAIQKEEAQNLSVPESWNTYPFGSLINANSGTKITQYN